jgi:hypothetical protein
LENFSFELKRILLIRENSNFEVYEIKQGKSRYNLSENEGFGHRNGVEGKRMSKKKRRENPE